jgi:hypothetical protein
MNSILTAISMKDKFITIPGILQPTYAGYKLNDRNWRKKIMQELKVDSLLFLSFEVRQELPWYAPGFAQSLLSSATFNVHMLRCQLKISAFNSKGDDPIWKTGLEDGGQSENPSFKVYGIAFPDIKQAAVMSSCSRALDQHLARLN